MSEDSPTPALDSATAPLVDSAALAALGTAPGVPFRVELLTPAAMDDAAAQRIGAGGQARGRVECLRVLRHLPGRRVVAEARWEGRRVLCKLFVDADARRRADREVAGSRWLATAGVPTPRLLGHWTLQGGGRALLFDWLERAEPLADHDTEALALAAAQLARLHAAGLRHLDPHPDNLLVVRAAPGAPVVYFVDPDGVRRGPRVLRGATGLARRASLANLALLCAQRRPDRDGELTGVFEAYRAARGWAGGIDADALGSAVTRARARRMRRYLRKTTRSCTEYAVRRAPGERCIWVRERVGPALGALLEHADRAVAAGALLKDGRSATVVRVRVDGQSWVIKRYNVKNVWQRLRRSLRPVPRYRNAWRNGQRLHLLGIPTARPIALVERRWGLLRDAAYLVMEDLGDVDLLGAAQRGELGPGIVGGVAALFATLRALGIAHGDTKATNFLLVADAAPGAGPDSGAVEARVALIDLDAMRESRRGAARDIERFLANWQRWPELGERFRTAFRNVGLRVD